MIDEPEEVGEQAQTVNETDRVVPSEITGSESGEHHTLPLLHKFIKNFPPEADIQEVERRAGEIVFREEAGSGESRL